MSFLKKNYNFENVFNMKFISNKLFNIISFLEY